jgi:alpha/beta hydrolase fold
MTATSPIVLEPAAQQVADAFSKPPFLYEMTPTDARKVLEDAQSGPVSKLPVDEEWITTDSDRAGLRHCSVDHRAGASKGLDASRMAVAGESVGGNMTAALALMAKERGNVTFVQQSMYYPVTDAAMNTAS